MFVTSFFLSTTCMAAGTDTAPRVMRLFLLAGSRFPHLQPLSRSTPLFLFFSFLHFGVGRWISYEKCSAPQCIHVALYLPYIHHSKTCIHIYNLHHRWWPLFPASHFFSLFLFPSFCLHLSIEDDIATDRLACHVPSRHITSGSFVRLTSCGNWFVAIRLRFWFWLFFSFLFLFFYPLIPPSCTSCLRR